MEIKVEIKKQVNKLYTEGLDLLQEEYKKNENNEEVDEEYNDTSKEKKKLPIHVTYQSWYSKALPLIKQVLPDRYQEFKDLYKLDKRKEDKIDFITYTISDYLLGLTVTRGVGYSKTEVVNPFSAFASKFQNQLFILQSAKDRIESILSDIESILQSNLFEDELEAAEDLLKKGHKRASGALSGVTLEAHLAKIFKAHNLKSRKKNLTISDYNDLLKKEEIIDTPQWRLIQRLGDIRNLCVHSKEREPTKDEVQDLIIGTKKAIAEIF